MSGALRLPDYGDVALAANRIAGIAHKTPVLTSRTADQRTGATLFFKCENLQRSGAFKFRGACNAIAALSEAERARGVVAFSSGNHAQAMALGGAAAETPRHHRDADGRACHEGGGDARLRRRGRLLRPLQRGSRGDRPRARRRTAASP